MRKRERGCGACGCHRRGLVGDAAGVDRVDGFLGEGKYRYEGKKRKKEKWRASKREEWGVPFASGRRVW